MSGPGSRLAPPASRSTEELLRVWSDEPVPPEDPASAGDRRKLVVGRMATAIREAAEERARARKRLRWVGALAAAAAVLIGVGVGVGGWRSGSAAPVDTGAIAAAPRSATLRDASGDVVVVKDGARTLAPTGAELALARGDEVVTGPDARAHLDIEGGAEVDAAAATSLRLAAAAEAAGSDSDRIGLSTGRVTVRVRKLEGGRTFGVRAPDAEVIVHGTAFEVAVRPNDGGAAGTITSVAVSEGVVLVRHAAGEIELLAGQSWSSAAPTALAPTDEAPPTADTPRPPEAAPAAHASRAPSAIPGHRHTPASEPATPSQLAEQNRLFQAAMSHKRQGADRAAIAALDELLARHPRSPLAPEARIERMRALQRLGDHAAAARDARRYLAEHENGAARDEAKDVAVSPTAKPTTRPQGQ